MHNKLIFALRMVKFLLNVGQKCNRISSINIKKNSSDLWFLKLEIVWKNLHIF